MKVLSFLVIFLFALPLSKAVESQYSVNILKPIPTFILAPEEKIRLRLTDYFSGFNLSLADDINTSLFSPTSQTKKLNILSSIGLETDWNNILSIKSLDIDDSFLLAILNDDASVSLFVFRTNEGIVRKPKISIEKMEKCFDLEFIDGDTIVVDCNIESEKAFVFIELQTSKIEVVRHDTKYIRHTNRRLSPSSNSYPCNIVCFIPTDDTKDPETWQIIKPEFGKDYELKEINKYTIDDFSIKNEGFKLNDLRFLNDDQLLLAGDDRIYWISSLQSGKAKRFKIDSPGISISSHNVSPTSTYITVRSIEGAFGFIASRSAFDEEYERFLVDLNYVSLIDQPYKVGDLEITKDYIVQILESESPKIVIFRRGDPDFSQLFYTSSIGKNEALDFPKIILASNEDNTLYWVTETMVNVIKVEELILEIQNSRPANREIVNIAVCSGQTCLKDKINTILLEQNDKSIFIKFNNSLVQDQRGIDSSVPEIKLTKNDNQSLQLNLDNFFIGPCLEYSIRWNDGDSSVLSKDSSQTFPFHSLLLYLGVRYDTKSNNLTVFQQPLATGELEEYTCIIYPNVMCAKKTTLENLGTIRGVYTINSYYNIIQVSDEINIEKSIFYQTPQSDETNEEDDEDPNENIQMSIGPCDAVCQSLSQQGGQLLFCSKGRQLIVFTTSSKVTITLSQFSKKFKARKILSHPSSPKVLFIGNNTHIHVVSSESNFTENGALEVISLISIEDKDFNFVVASKYLILFLPNTNQVIGYDISNPADIFLSKPYLLYSKLLPITERTLVYSPNTDFVYFCVEQTDLQSRYIAVLDPNGLGHSNLKYLIPFTASNYDDLIVSVASSALNKDYLVFSNGIELRGEMISKTAEFVLNKDLVKDESDLFSTVQFNIEVKSLFGGSLTYPGQLTIVNTQRKIQPLVQGSDIPFFLQENKTASLTFAGEKFFKGPVFNLRMSSDYSFDNIKFVSRVQQISNRPLTTLDFMALSSASTSKGYDDIILILSYRFPQELLKFSASGFPSHTSLIEAFELPAVTTKTGKGILCSKVEVDQIGIYAAILCSSGTNKASYFYVYSLTAKKVGKLTLPNKLFPTTFKMISDYLVYTTQNNTNGVFIYKVIESNQKEDLALEMITEVKRSQLTLFPTQQPIVSMDGCLGNDGQVHILLIVKEVGFSYITLSGDSIKLVTQPFDFWQIVNSEDMYIWNRMPRFSGIKLLGSRFDPEPGQMYFSMILTSQDALAYRINLILDSLGQCQDKRVIDAFVQYQGYSYRDKVQLVENYIVLVGDKIVDDIQVTNYFFYDTKSSPVHNDDFPVRDTFQAIEVPYQAEGPLLLLKKDEKVIVYLTDKSQSSGILAYQINDVFSLKAADPNIMSTYLKIKANNNFCGVEITVPIQQYSPESSGLKLWAIILIAAVSLMVICFAFMCLRKLIVSSDKNELKDTFTKYEEL